MYVCICASVTTSQVKKALDGGAHTLKELRTQLNVLNYCGHCKCTLVEMLKEHKQEENKV